MNETNRSHRVLLRSSAVIMAVTLLSRIVGLVRTKVINYYFKQEILDPFWSAYKIPNTLREMLAEGALSVAFIPVFTSFLIKHGDEAASELTSNVFNILLSVVLVLSGIGMLTAHLIIPFYVTGFSSDLARMNLAVELTRIMMPFLVFASSGAIVMGVLNGRKHFFAPAFAPIFFSIGMIAVVLLFHDTAGPRTLGWGVLAGGVAQLLFQIPFLKGRGFRYRFRFNLKHPGVREVLRLMLPAAMALGVVQLNQLIAPFFASYTPGGMAALQNSILLVQMPQGVFAIALSTALLPTLSEHAVRGERDAFSRSMSDGLGLVLFFSIPAALFFIFMGRPVIEAVFFGGKFGAADLQRTAPALLYYSLGLIGMGGTVLANRFFYALRDMKTPFYVAVASVLVNLVFNVVFHLARAGFELIALSNSLAVTMNFVVLIILIQRKMGRFEWGGILLESGKITIASCLFVLTSVLVWQALYPVPPRIPVGTISGYLPVPVAGIGFTGRLLRLAVSGTAGLAVFTLASRLLRVREISLLLGYMKKKKPAEDA